MTLLLRTGGTLWSEIGVLFLIISGHFDILFPKIPTGYLQFSQIGVLEGFYNEYLWKYIENQGLNKHQYCFANISGTKARILMKFYVVVNYYLVSLSFKFHKNPCTNARAQVVNARTRDKTCARAFTARARAFMHESSWNLKLKLPR